MSKIIVNQIYPITPMKLFSIDEASISKDIEDSSSSVTEEESTTNNPSQ